MAHDEAPGLRKRNTAIATNIIIASTANIVIIILIAFLSSNFANIQTSTFMQTYSYFYFDAADGAFVIVVACCPEKIYI